MSALAKTTSATLALASLGGIGAAALASNAEAVTIPVQYAWVHNAVGGGYSSYSSCMTNRNGAINTVWNHGGRRIGMAPGPGNCTRLAGTNKWTYGYFHYVATHALIGNDHHPRSTAGF